ncbi:hypothetical protein H6771_02800 [Candidatus Peribacteria bacterium]|nr:hypothetical protein [Candidatus Peribacteria bacterium]
MRKYVFIGLMTVLLGGVVHLTAQAQTETSTTVEFAAPVVTSAPTATEAPTTPTPTAAVTTAAATTPEDTTPVVKRFEMYHLSTCPHCQQQLAELMPTLEATYPDVEFAYWEVGSSSENASQFRDRVKQFAPGIKDTDIAVPTNIIANRDVIMGYRKDDILQAVVNNFGQPLKSPEGMAFPTPNDERFYISGYGPDSAGEVATTYLMRNNTTWYLVGGIVVLGLLYMYFRKRSL